MKEDAPKDIVQSDNTRHVPIGILVFVSLLAFLWGGNIVAIKTGLQGLPPFAAAGVRFSIALPLIALWAAVRRQRLIPSKKEVPGLIVLGLVFTVQIALINAGTNLTLAGRATVLLNAYPVYVAALSHVFVPGDRLSAKKAVGLIVAFGGVVTVFGAGFFENDRATLLGDAMVLISGVLLAVLVVMISRIAQKTPPVRLLTAEMVVGVPIFFLLSALLEQGAAHDVTLRVGVALAYQGVVVATFCFIAWSTVLKTYPPSRVSVIFFTTPLWGVVLSFFILGERISAMLIVGAALVAVGIYLVNRRV